MNRRELLTLIGAAGGSAAMYMAMTSLGFAQGSPYKEPIHLEGDPKGASVLVLGAGLAGMVAALELRHAGYRVQVLEYNARAGGRNWTLRGGDSFTELGGFTQNCMFADGLYINPGPWRIPYHHHALLDYCKRLGVALEPFIQINYNAYLHSAKAFDGRPQRFRAVQADFHGHVAELLAKAAGHGALDDAVTKEDQERLLEALVDWGALDRNHIYAAGFDASDRRGWQKDPGGGASARPVPSQPVALPDLLKSGLWAALGAGADYDYQQTLFQPVGGMDMIGRAFARALDGVIRYDARVTAIRQDEHGVTVSYADRNAHDAPMQAHADWCLCTIPLSILSQIDINVGDAMQNAIEAVPYAAAAKIGLQFRRRFWEEDERIYGGISYTDLPIRMIGYPASGYFKNGSGVLLGAYAFGPFAFEFTALDPAGRVRKAVEYGAQVHPQYTAEFENGVGVGWHRVPWTLGCFGMWSAETRKTHYDALTAIDGRILLAGEHASYLPAWQEGAVLSALDAITRLHERVMAG
jgi:monoamine oxidase